MAERVFTAVMVDTNSSLLGVNSAGFAASLFCTIEYLHVILTEYKMDLVATFLPFYRANCL